MKVSCIIPTRLRPAQARHCVDAFFATTAGHDVECIVVADSDQATVDAMEGSPAIVIMNKKRRGAIRSWNIGAMAATGDAFVFGADDLYWRAGWLDATLAALKMLPNEQGVVGLNCLDRDDDVATHYLITRRAAIDVLGGVLAIPHYHHYWSDPEVTERAKRAGCYVMAATAIVEHRSHMVGRAPNDMTYAEALRWFPKDEEIYNKRLAAGFPSDYEPVIK